MPTPAKLLQDSFLSVETVHLAAVQWWWHKDKLHDSDYAFRVRDAVNAKVEDVVNRYASVRQDIQFCCQWEGVQLEGSDLSEVTAAAQEIVRVLARFKGVVPLNL